MSRKKLFIENFVIYGIGGSLSKLVPFIMLPILTYMFPNSSYIGISDIITVTTTFGSVIAVMGMYDAMFRMFFDKDDITYKKQICSTAYYAVLVFSFLISVILILFKNSVSQLLFDTAKYNSLLMILTINIVFTSVNSIVSAPTRMKNKRLQYLSINLLSSLLVYAITIFLILKGEYLWALPVGNLVSLIFVYLVYRTINGRWFKLVDFNFSLLKKMLLFALPLLPNVLLYWVLNSADRLMISKMMGAEAVGIYAVGAKIGHVSQLIYMAFSGGWQYFMYTTMHDQDQKDLITRMFEYLGIATFIAGIFMSLISRPFFENVFPSDYAQANIIATYLFIAPLLLMLFQIVSDQFLVIKKTIYLLAMDLLGAITNVLFNFVLIQKIGIEGAAVGTILSYIIMLSICVFILIRKGLFRLTQRFVIAISLMGFYMVSWRLFLRQHILLNLGMALLVSLVDCYMYRSDLYELLKNDKKERKI